MNGCISVAFWGETSGSGTSIGISAVAGMYSMRHPEIKTAVLKLNTPEIEHAFAERGVPANKADIDVLFIDCGCSRSSDCFRILESVSIVVVNLSQNEHYINRYVLEDMRILPDAMILVGNYYDEEYDRSILKHKYRISDEKMGVIPANEEFAAAFHDEKLRYFLKQEQETGNNERNRLLMGELLSFTRKLEHRIDYL